MLNVSTVLRIAARLAIRNKNKEFFGKFSLDHFKHLESVSDMELYANTRLETLGQGSSRTAFAFSSKKVLKIARSEPGSHVRGGSTVGIEQNKKEVDVYTDPATKPIVTKVFEADHEYRWILSEIVRPLSSASEFEDLTGHNLSDLTIAVDEVWQGTLSRNEVDSDLHGELFDALLGLAASGVDPGDFSAPGHWGKTPEGRVVVLDYGFAEGLYGEYYARGILEKNHKPAAHEVELQKEQKRMYRLRNMALNKFSKPLLEELAEKGSSDEPLPFEFYLDEPFDGTRVEVQNNYEVEISVTPVGWFDSIQYWKEDPVSRINKVVKRIIEEEVMFDPEKFEKILGIENQL